MKRIIAIMLLAALVGVQPTRAAELEKIRCTCYTDEGVTASGAATRHGIIAGKREWLGNCAAIYSITEDGSVGDFIGYYEFLDTGAGMDTDGDGKGDTIINGESVDIYRYTLKEAKNWIKTYGDYVYIKIIENVEG